MSIYLGDIKKPLDFKFTKTKPLIKNEKNNLINVLDEVIYLDKGSFTARQLLLFLKQNGLANQKLTGGRVKIVLNAKKSSTDGQLDIDIFIKANNKEEIRLFTILIHQFLKENAIYTGTEFKKNKDKSSINVKLGLLDLTISEKYGTLGRTDKEWNIINIWEEEIVYPDFFESYETLLENQKSILTGCSSEHLEKLSGNLIPFFTHMFVQRLVDKNEFIKMLYQKSFDLYLKQEENEYIKKQKNRIKFYLTEHIPKNNNGTRLAILLGIALLVYRNHGMEFYLEENQAFCKVFWEEVIYEEMIPLLDKEQVFGSDEEKLTYDFINELISSEGESTESVTFLANLYENLSSFIPIGWISPKAYETSEQEANILQIILKKNKIIFFDSPTGKETTTHGWDKDSPPIIFIQKKNLKGDHPRNLFSGSWFDAFKKPMSPQEKTQFRMKFKEIKNQKQNTKIQDFFKDLSKWLNITKNPFESYSILKSTPIDEILQQWDDIFNKWIEDKILNIWMKDSDTGQECAELLSGIGRVLCFVNLSSPENSFREKWQSLYFELLAGSMIDGSLDKKTLETYSLPYLSPAQMVYHTILELEQHYHHQKESIHNLLTALLSQLGDFSELSGDEKKKLSQLLKNLFPFFLAKTNPNSEKDLDVLLQIIPLINSKITVIPLAKEKMSTKTIHILELEKQQQDIRESKKLFDCVCILKELCIDDKKHLKKLTLLIEFYLENYSLNYKIDISYWISLLEFLLKNNKTPDSAANWMILKRTGHNLLKQKKPDFKIVIKLLNLWDEIAFPCTNESLILSYTEDLFELLITFSISNNGFKNHELLNWIIGKQHYIKHLLLKRTICEFPKTQKSAREITVIYQTIISEASTFETKFQQNYYHSLKSFAKAAKEANTSISVKQMICRVHFYFFSKWLTWANQDENLSFDQFVKSINYRKEWIFPENNQDKISLNLDFIITFLRLKLDSISNNLLSPCLSDIFEMLKDFDYKNLPENFASYLILCAEIGLKKQNYIFAEKCSQLASKYELIQNSKETMEFLDLLLQHLIEEKNLSDKDVNSLHLMFNRFNHLVSPDDISDLSISLLETEYSKSLGIDTIIKNKIFNKEALKTALKQKSNSTCLILENSIPVILKSLEKNPPEGKHYIFILEPLIANFKKQLVFIEFIKKILSISSYLERDDLIQIAEIIQKLPLKSLKLPTKTLLLALIEKWSKSSKALIKNLIKTSEKDNSISFTFLKTLISKEECTIDDLESLQDLQEQNIKNFEKDDITQFIKLLTENKKLKEAKSLISKFTKDSTNHNEFLFKNLMKLHINEIAINPLSDKDWNALSKAIKDLFTNKFIFSNEEAKDFFQELEMVMTKKNFKIIIENDSLTALYFIIFCIHNNSIFKKHKKIIAPHARKYFMDYLSLVFGSKKNNFFNEFLNYFQQPNISSTVTGLEHEFMASLLYEGYQWSMKNDDKFAKISTATNLNINCYIIKKNQNQLSYKLLKYSTNLPNDLKKLENDIFKYYLIDSEILFNQVSYSKLLEPLKSSKENLDKFFEKFLENDDYNIKFFNLYYYLGSGFLRVQNFEDISSAIENLVLVLEKMFNFSQRKKHLMNTYFNYANEFIQRAVNLHIELSQKNHKKNELSSLILKNMYHSIPLDKESFEFDKNDNVIDIASFFKPLDTFIEKTFIRQIELYCGEGSTNCLADLYGALTRYLCYDIKKFIINPLEPSSKINMKNIPKYFLSNKGAPYLYPTYIAMARYHLFVLHSGPSNVLKWIKEIDFGKAKNIFFKEVIAQNLQILIQESFCSPTNGHQKFSLSLISSVIDDFDLSKFDQVNIVAETILYAITNPESLNDLTLGGIFELINKYLIDESSKDFHFKDPNFFIKKIIPITYKLLYVTNFKEDYSLWLNKIHYIQGLLFQKYILGVESIYEDETYLIFTDIYKNKKEDHQPLPSGLDTLYDQMVTDLIKSIYTAIIKETSNQTWAFNEATQTFEFFENLGFLKDANDIKKQLKEILIEINEVQTSIDVSLFNEMDKNLIENIDHALKDD